MFLEVAYVPIYIRSELPYCLRKYSRRDRDLMITSAMVKSATPGRLRDDVRQVLPER